MKSNFPEIITTLRKKRGISQKQAAIELGISQALLSHYEKGIRECGLDFLMNIADYYGVTCDYLLGHSTAKGSRSAETTTQRQIIRATEFLLLLVDLSANEELKKECTDSLKYLIYSQLHLFDKACPNLEFEAEESAALLAAARSQLCLAKAQGMKPTLSSAEMSMSLQNIERASRLIKEVEKNL